MYAQFNFPRLTLTNKILIFGSLGISGIFIILRSLGINEAAAVIAYLVVWPLSLLPWQPFTYFLVHPDFWSLIFNGLALWMFGNVLEQRMGTKRYLIAFAISVISSAMVYWIAGMALRVQAPYYGMLAGVLALLVCFAYFWPHSRVYVFGIFPVKSKWLVIGYGVIMLVSLSGGLTGRGLQIGILYGAVLLGVGFTLLYTQIVFLQYSFLRSLVGKFKSSISQPKTPKSTRSSSRDTQPDGENNRQKVVSIDDWERKQVDLLLEKVSKYGIKSLNKKEKEFLDRVSSTYSSKED